MNPFLLSSEFNRRAVLTGLQAGLPKAASAQTGQADQLESASSRDGLALFMKVISDSAGATTYTWSSGSLFAWLPGQGGHHVCDTYGLTVRRTQQNAGRWTVVARDGVMFCNIGTTDPITVWDNPFTQRTVAVVPSLSNTASQSYDTPPESWVIGNSLGFADNRSDLTPSVLTVEDYPLHAQDNLFKHVSLNTYYAPATAMTDSGLTAAAMTGVNTTVTPWLPWMAMGQRRGWLVWQQRLKKVRSEDDLPQDLTAYWRTTDPAIFDLDDDAAATPETPWTRFKTTVDAVRGEP